MADDTIYTTHGRDNPYLVTDPHHRLVAILCQRQVFLRDIEVYADRIVGIIQQTGKISLYLIFVNPVSLFHGGQGMADGVAILALHESFTNHITKSLQSIGKKKQDRMLKLPSHTAVRVNRLLRLQTVLRRML